MGRKGGGGKRQTSKPKKQQQQEQNPQNLWVDPRRIRFQHSRIRPYFSGCGRSVTETLESIRRREISPSDLPPIQVIVGPSNTDDGPWYFSLNNRRLWVLKRCREEGLLKDNSICVRVRSPKSDSEAERYTVEKCALEAKIMHESTPSSSTDPAVDANTKDVSRSGSSENRSPERSRQEDSLAQPDAANEDKADDDSDDSEDDDDDGVVFKSSNPFDALA